MKCRHKANALFCLRCWHERSSKEPREPDEPSPQSYTQIVHLTCGCRMTVTPGNEVVSWHRCQAGHDGDGMPRDARWFWHEAVKRGLVGEQHGLEGRATCDDERCKRAQEAVGRARHHAQRWTPPTRGEA